MNQSLDQVDQTEEQAATATFFHERLVTSMSVALSDTITMKSLARRYRVTVTAIGKAVASGDLPQPRVVLGVNRLWHADDICACDEGMRRRAERDPQKRQQRSGSAALKGI